MDSETVTYLLRDVPESLWRRVRALCALRGCTVRDLIIGLLEAETKGVKG